MNAPSRDAGEAAQLLAAVACTLPEATRRDLRDAIGLLCQPRSGSHLREHRLGLLVQMLDGTGQIPAGEDYDALRAARAAGGEDWPDRTALARAYGHWLAAVRAAMRHWHMGTRARVPHSYDHARNNPPPYTPAEAAEALRACRAALAPWRDDDDWPTRWEYETWATLARRAARQAGLPYPRTPVLRVLRKLFGSYTAAVAHARSSNDAPPLPARRDGRRRPISHGTVSCYARGCRCQSCRDAKREYRTRLRKREQR